MPKHVLTGQDVDLDAFIEEMRELADAVESDDIHVDRIVTADKVGAENPATREVQIRFVLTEDIDSNLGRFDYVVEKEEEA